uniref:StAR related lipid transfer domain containing 5 n=1 Tax=Oryzias sinensis TaxID=183150 RepID=A0A8C7WZ33_9TELE
SSADSFLKTFSRRPQEAELLFGYTSNRKQCSFLVLFVNNAWVFLNLDFLGFARCDSALSSSPQDVSVCRTVTPSAAMGIIAPRDFVDVIAVRRYEDGTFSSNATNVVHPSCPPQPGFVRGFNHPCGCFCVPVAGEPNRTQVLSFFQTDLGGLLPRSVVDSFFPLGQYEQHST